MPGALTATTVAVWRIHLRTITLDPTKYHFKPALLRDNYEEMFHIICASTLLGQSIMVYLQQMGFPEVWGCSGRRVANSYCAYFTGSSTIFAVIDHIKGYISTSIPPSNPATGG